MSKTEKWVIGGLCSLVLLALTYIINQVDGLKAEMSDLKVQVAIVGTKLDAHMAQHSKSNKPEKEVDP